MREVDRHRRLFPQESRERGELVARGSGKRQHVGVVPLDPRELVGLVRSGRAWRQSDQKSDQEAHGSTPSRLKSDVLWILSIQTLSPWIGILPAFSSAVSAKT